MTSLITTLILIEQHGPRIGMDELAKLMGWEKQTLLARIARKELDLPTYVDGKLRFADTRDVAEYLDRKREEARQALAA